MSITPRDPRARRSWGDDDSRSPILHVDMDSFFAAVEVALDPSLQGRPLIVGGTGTRGVVTSCTYDVRALGVRAGMPINQARALAPQALCLAGRREAYAQYSRRVMALLESVTPLVEVASIDEAYMDVSGAKLRFGSPRQIAEDLRARIREELHLPASVGVAATKTVAKIASAHAKPDGLLLVPAEATTHFLHSLAVSALPGIGKKTASLLEARGIETLAQLATWDENDLAKLIGTASAVSLQTRARGIDTSRVGPREAEKSISTEETFPVNLVDRAQVKAYLNHAAYRCASRLRSARMRAWTVQLKLKDGSFRSLTRSQTLSSPTDVGREIAASAIRLFDALRFPQAGVRLAGVGVQGLVPVDQGVPVPLEEDVRPRQVESVADTVQGKFGKAAVLPASSLGRPWEAPRERRTLSADS